MAYSFTEDVIQEVYDYLDLREINGYTRLHLPVFDASSPTIPIIENALVYIGTPDNPAFVGPPNSIDELARHIASCRGPSGENSEYLLNLAESIRYLTPDSKDTHVWDIEERVVEIMQNVSSSH